MKNICPHLKKKFKLKKLKLIFSEYSIE